MTKPLSMRELATRIAALVRPQRDAANPTHAAAQPTGERRLRVLVAEDNAVNQKLIERILERDGHEVAIAENGRICCELWASASFDLVLMDMQMPEMSGLEAASHIRREERASGTRVPIIALTANTTVEDRNACLHAGMDEVLPKPVSLPRLRAALARFAAAAGAPRVDGGES